MCIFGELWESFFFFVWNQATRRDRHSKTWWAFANYCNVSFEIFSLREIIIFYCMIHLHFLKLCKKARKKLIDRPFKILIHSQVKAKFDCQHLGIIFFSIFWAGKVYVWQIDIKAFDFSALARKEKFLKGKRKWLKRFSIIADAMHLF